MWKCVWGGNQIDYRSSPSRIGNCIQRICIRSNNSTDRVRVHFSNRYGVEPLVLEHPVFRVGAKAYPLTCKSGNKICLLPGTECNSDPLVVSVLPGDLMEVTFLVRQQTVLTGGIVIYSTRELAILHTGAETGTVITQSEVFAMVRDNNRMNYVFGVDGIDFDCSEQEQTVVAFGDSLTHQGYWADHLRQRLRESGRKHMTVVNRGIGGSRILAGTSPLADRYQRHGRSGLERFEPECFGSGIPDLVIVFHGINDLITRHSRPSDYSYSLDDIIKGLKTYAEIAHRHGTMIWIGTLLPLGRSIFYCEQLEAERLLLNAWIRSQKDFDGVMDFDRAVCSAFDSSLLDERWDAGDGLHISDAGGRVIAETIEL